MAEDEETDLTAQRTGMHIRSQTYACTHINMHVLTMHTNTQRLCSAKADSNANSRLA